ncbi:pirin family protein [Heterostelium album PN500]|uniref:Pirin family protein n=1 Tax=Heterostelium pallidum (strain ATCC 26659 / Pp 5 / PN500) TaxID=670386 RepID=D3B665_HETP5|nr:pirin family protein [Heterostelium album PN500]EFA83363.1 pirin family protein [Heterostelium album PN500]|eukprot:XP_020435480.1 pirin family protein [Heterostelium album PN500]
MTSVRKVSKISSGTPTVDGGGVSLLRVIGQNNRLDPFLMLDEFRSDNPDDYIEGFPSHPHRGFETVTYMLAGIMEHQDHKGNKGLLTPGSIQWMTAGRGIIHSEMPKQENGLMQGFQLWINASIGYYYKITFKPRYQDIPPERIPVVSEVNGSKVKVLAGKYKDVTGPVSGIETEPIYLDVELVPGSTFSEEIPVGHSAFVYVFKGSCKFGPSQQQREVGQSNMAVLDGGAGETSMEAFSEKGCRFLLVSAKPINEPIEQYGPFVMNTKQELMQAFDDYQNGRF